jgi:hypothetical protein
VNCRTEDYLNKSSNNNAALRFGLGIVAHKIDTSKRAAQMLGSWFVDCRTEDT